MYQRYTHADASVAVCGRVPAHRVWSGTASVGSEGVIVRRMTNQTALWIRRVRDARKFLAVFHPTDCFARADQSRAETVKVGHPDQRDPHQVVRPLMHPTLKPSVAEGT